MAKKTQVVEALAEEPIVEYNFPHGEVTPVLADDLENIDWSTVLHLRRSNSGSEGVLFVELPGKKAVVVKSPSKIAAEYYGTWLCETLHINCPAMELVLRASEKGQIMMAAFEKADARIAHEFIGCKQAILVIEYLQADELADKYAPLSDQAWTPETFGALSGSESSELNENGKKVLTDFGSLVAFDMLINNFDRLPCIWDNSGNPGNVMFRKDGHSVVSIDNMVCCISNKYRKGVESFCQRVETCVTKVCHDADKPHEEFRRIAQMLKVGCPDGQGWIGLGIDVGDAGVLLIQQGFLNTIQLAVDGTDGCEGGLTREKFQGYYDTLKNCVADEHPVLAGLEAIDVDFFDSVMTAWKKALESEGRGRADTHTPYLCVRFGTGPEGKIQRCRSGAVYIIDGEEVPILSAERKSIVANFFDKEFLGRNPEHKPKAVVESEHKEEVAEIGKLFDEGLIARKQAGTAKPKVVEESEEKQHKVLAPPTLMAVIAANKLLSKARLKIKANARQIAKAQSQEAMADGFHDLSKLACPPPWPEGVEGICREQYLSPDDFATHFGMDKTAFAALPKWKQQQKKKQKKLF